MYDVKLLDLFTGHTFTRSFNDLTQFNIFLTRVKYSKKVKLISIINNEYLYN